MKFWGGLTAFVGIFLFVVGGVAGARAKGSDGLDFSDFDAAGLLIVGLGVLVAESLSLWLERRRMPVMPDVGLYTRRSTAVFLTGILSGFVVGIANAAPVLAVIFVVLKTAADLKTGRLPGEPQRPRV